MAFTIPYLSPERKKELIDKIASWIVENHWETAAILFLESFKPMRIMGSQFAIFFGAPWLPLFGGWGTDAIALLQDKDSLENLLKRIEELTKEREKTDQLAKSKK